MAVCLGKVIGPTCGEDAMKIIDNLMRVMRAVEVAKQCPYDIDNNNEGGGAWRSTAAPTNIVLLAVLWLTTRGWLSRS